MVGSAARAQMGYITLQILALLGGILLRQSEWGIRVQLGQSCQLQANAFRFPDGHLFVHVSCCAGGTNIEDWEPGRETVEEMLDALGRLKIEVVKKAQLLGLAV